MVACQVTLSMGFSRQEYWSNLPFPSPGYFPNQELNLRHLPLLYWQSSSFTSVPAGKPKYFVKANRILSLVRCRLWILQARILEWIAISDPGIEPQSPALQADSLPLELPGKPAKWTGFVKIISYIQDFSVHKTHNTRSSHWQSSACKAVKLKSGNCSIIGYYNDICQHETFACVCIQIKFLTTIVYSPNMLISPYNKFQRRQNKYLNNPNIVNPLHTAFYLFFFYHPQTFKGKKKKTKNRLITSKDEKG